MIDYLSSLLHGLFMMKFRMLKGCVGVLMVVVPILLNSCASSPDAGGNPGDLAMKKIQADTEAKKYNLVLLDAIQDSDRIVIREHSDRVDFFGMNPVPQTLPEYTYVLKELSIGEKILFQDDIMALRGVAKQRVTNSIFTPHHTIEFYEQGSLRSTMKICFGCPAIRWDGTDRKESEDVYRALTTVILRAGMQPNGAWDVMAKKKYAEENPGILPNPDPKLNPVPIPGDVPVAKWAEGQVGKKVLNPYTGKLVDVQGIPANTKVRDPNDTDPKHVFRVPSL